jgi:hypothetical protein
VTLERKSEIIDNLREKIIIGNLTEVTRHLKIAQELFLADEIMILTITDNIEDRLKSYQLLANLL